MKPMKYDKGVSALLFLLAVALAGPEGISEALGRLGWELLVPCLLVAMLASVIEFYKSVFVIKGSVESTLESMHTMPQITITGNNEQLIQGASSLVNSFTKGITKTMGKVMLVFYKVADFGVKAAASLCALLYLVFPRVELVGLWIILSTVFLVVLFKFSNLFGMFMPFGSKPSSKRTLGGFAAMSLFAWILYSVSMWMFFGAFGVWLSPLAFFFFTGLFVMLSLMPFTFDGIGVIELVGMGAFSVLGVPLALSLVCLVAWEASKFMGDFVVAALPEGRNKALDAYR